MKVVATGRSQVLAARIAAALGAGVAEARFSRFPDGEHALQRGPLDGETVVVGSVTDADSFVQLLLLIDACRDSEIRLVVRRYAMSSDRSVTALILLGMPLEYR